MMGRLQRFRGTQHPRVPHAAPPRCLVLSGTVDVELPRSQPQLHVSQPHVGQPSDPRVAGRPEYRSLGPGAALGWEALLRDDHRARASMTAGPAGEAEGWGSDVTESNLVGREWRLERGWRRNGDGVRLGAETSRWGSRGGRAGGREGGAEGNQARGRDGN